MYSVQQSPPKIDININMEDIIPQFYDDDIEELDLSKEKK